MKTFSIILIFLGMLTTSYSQEEIKNDLDNEVLKMDELPEIVIKSVGKDFSVYLPDKNPDNKVKNLQQKFIAYNLGKDYEGYENFLIVMETNDGSLTASYNSNGKLTRVIEKYQNVKLPSKVIYAVYKAYPGWQLVNDKFLYTQEDGDIIKKQYQIKIKKDNETRKLVIHPNGDFIKDLN